MNDGSTYYTKGYPNSETSYHCGFLRYEKFTITNTKNCQPGKMDRGWFRRLHDTCKNGECNDDLKNVNVYSLLLAYSIVCGLGWFIASWISLYASLKTVRQPVLVTAFIYAILYIISLVMFGVIWNKIKKVENDCPSFECNKYAEQAKRSAREFLAYSICGIINVLAILILTFIPAYMFRASYEDPEYTTPQPRKIEYDSDRPNNEINPSDMIHVEFNQATPDAINFNIPNKNLN